MGLLSARFLLRTLLNHGRLRMNRELIGHSIERTVGPVTAEVAAAYAAATNDDNVHYRGGDALAPPLLISRLVLPLVQELMVHPRLGMNLLRAVHGEQRFAWHRPIRINDRVRLRLSVAALRETPAGDLLQLDGRAYDQAGDLYGEATIGLLVRGRGGGDRSSRPAPEHVAPPADDDHGQQPALRIALPTTADQALRYAAASGDDNFIHVSPLMARLAGLPRTVLHGACVLAMATAALIREQLEGDVQRAQDVQARFCGFALPGDELTLVARHDPGADAVLRFEILDPRGRQVIKAGRLRFRS